MNEAVAPLALAPHLYDGKTALVSGGGSGLGLAIAWVLARLGAHVVICGRRQDKLDTARAAIRGAGLKLDAQVCDIRDEGAVEPLFEFVEQRCGTLHLLVNNAGGQFAQSAIDISAKGWRSVVELNLNGTFTMMQRAAKSWVRRSEPGAIVNIAASCARGMPGIAHSSAARAGVINLTKTAATEWAPHSIRVTCLAPGVIATQGLEVYDAAARVRFADSNPQRALGDPWEIAQTAAFLGCDAARFINGATLTADGGGACWGDLWTIERPAWFADSARGGS
jgi:citronellol/citronellal dehydrogenase